MGAWRGFGGGRLRKRIDASLHVARRLGWTLHPYLRQPYETRLEQRPFDPLRVLAPSTHDALFGAEPSFARQTVVQENP